MDALISTAGHRFRARAFNPLSTHHHLSTTTRPCFGYGHGVRHNGVSTGCALSLWDLQKASLAVGRITYPDLVFPAAHASPRSTLPLLWAMAYGVRSNGMSAGCALSLRHVHKAKPLDATPITDLLPPLHSAHHFHQLATAQLYLLAIRGHAAGTNRRFVSHAFSTTVLSARAPAPGLHGMSMSYH